jgi:hypothetical protein
MRFGCNGSFEERFPVSYEESLEEIVLHINVLFLPISHIFTSVCLLCERLLVRG